MGMMINRRRVYGGGKNGAYERGYLTFIAIENTTFANTQAMEYTLDNGNTWVALAANTSTPTVEAGSMISMRGVVNADVGISSTGLYDAEGNPYSLIYGDAFDAQPLNAHRRLYQMFFGDTHIVNAENLTLPPTTLRTNHYSGMFRGCTNLITPPALPATTLAQNCYYGMFRDCKSLAYAPALPATEMRVQSCYVEMFYGCTSLTTPPALPATTLVSYCYNSMFYGCTSLTTIPNLPATVMKDRCYNGMFQGCTALQHIDAACLPSTSLSVGCYASMFKGCTNLKTKIRLPATTLATYCYSNMFESCTSLTDAPILPATTLLERCYYAMFIRSGVVRVECMAVDMSANNCLTNWLYNVAATGTFVKHPDATWNTGVSGIPNGWTVEDAVIEEE